MPIDPSVLAEKAPRSYRPILQADSWYCKLNSGDDRVYEAAQLIENVPEDGPLIELLSTAHRSPNRRSGSLSLRWEMEVLPPRFRDDPSDIPLEAFAALTNLHLGHIRPDLEHALFDAALKRLEKRVEGNPFLRPELATFALSVGCYEAAARIAPELAIGGDPFEAVAALAAQIPDPYHLARSLTALLPFFAGLARQDLLAAARQAASTIPNYSHRARVLESLIVFPPSTIARL